ncbi:hypothetical protein F5Y15DRAFT_116190 [Xylariaceae sp. FL0016]|nr:hypothetical protein F5Y15DRAFT_116190 [Xylariaceae sp. FL0016]
MEPTGVALSEDSTQPQPQRSSSPDGLDETNSAQKKATIRKRTKTGCLTCRKRRIKCDEGRPTCNNCLKSKRQCEGYNQRVIFKDPLGAFAGAPYGPIQYPDPSPQALVREQQLSAAQQRASSQSLQIIAPKPPIVGYHQIAGNQFNHYYPGPAGPAAHQALNFDPIQYDPQPPPSKFTFFPPTTVDAFSQAQWKQDTQADLNTCNHAVSEDITHDVSSGNSQQPRSSRPDKGKKTAETQPQPHGLDFQFEQLEEWEHPNFEDDVSMADSEEGPPLSRHDAQFSLNEMSLVMSDQANHPYNVFGTQRRTFSAYAAENLLATYDPSPLNSPLNDKQIAAVFWHFVNVTGPSMSLFERQPNNPSTIFQGGTIPKTKQHIWTYTFPIQSFSHPALLQAMLALGSLQIAKLQQVPPTASLKHYHLALRRIAKNVTRPARRTQASNLAATLLLGFYEVWNSDHDKWSRHLLGARWIMKDIPLSEMSRAIMTIKMGRRQRAAKDSQLNASDTFSPPEENTFLYKDWDLVDVPFLRAITGREISYDELGMLPDEMSTYPKARNMHTLKDMERYEQLSDLFWWYSKMDVYQSILGGTRPFMEYEKWTQCPPRAPMCRPDALFGTYDHLMLLLARLTTFTSHDLARKREAMRKNKTAGPKSPPGMFPGMMPASEKMTFLPMGFSPPRDIAEPAGQQSYVPRMGSGGPDDYESYDADLDTRTAEACREWEQIREAFDTFASALERSEFTPLGPDVHPALATPFGTASHYRTYSIAGIWMNYYMGLIVLHRAHPGMPPVAMLAAGLSARTTMPHALALGRIAAGLEENIADLTAVSTLMGAALIECAFPLFVAGIQYQDDQQRQWLVRRLHDIARLTGWQSAHQIADGCESAWTKAAQYGRGPPYKRSDEVEARAGMWPNPRRIDRRIQELNASSGPGAEGGDGGSDISVVWVRTPGEPVEPPQRLPRTGDGQAGARGAHEEHQPPAGIGTEMAPSGGESKRIVLAKGEKAFYAMGLLAVEHDLENLDLDDAEKERRK